MKNKLFEHTMRWYGPNDAVSLLDIKQSGATGVVTALHHIPNGEVWSIEEINKRKDEVEQAGLSWSVVESLPIHESIKLALPESKQLIEHYKQSLINLSKCGIHVVTYNFMPILDWTRTRLYHELPDQTKALYFDIVDLAAFDLFILERENAQQDYTKHQIEQAEQIIQKMSEEEKQELTLNILAGLPGSEDGYELSEFKERLALYKGVTKSQLQQNLVAFLKQIAPTAEQHGVRLAIHPDDPPFSIFGIPRFVSTKEDIDFILSEVPSESNGLCFCTGSFGANPKNDLVEMASEYVQRIHFLHFRSVEIVGDRHFYEADHLEGNANFVQLIRLFKNDQRKVPMRPDHGHAMLDDLKKKTNPGYTCIGRMKGLRALMGIEKAVIQIEN